MGLRKLHRVTSHRVVEFSTAVLPADLFGDQAVGLDSDGEVYLVNITIGERRQLTNDGHRKFGAVISTDYVAWIDQRRKIELPETDSATPLFGDGIFLLDLSTGKERRITDKPAGRRFLQMSGSRLVGQDNRNELGEHYTHFDIYAYDLRKRRGASGCNRPRSSTVAAYLRRLSRMGGQQDPVMGTPEAGCGNCSDNRFDIYSYDFTTGEERPLVESGLNNGPRSIHGQYVVWQGSREDSGSDINVLDLGDRHKRTVAKVDRPYVGPLVSGNFMVWTVREDCDSPGGLPENVPTGAFALNLKTDESSPDIQLRRATGFAPRKT